MSVIFTGNVAELIRGILFRAPRSNERTNRSYDFFKSMVTNRDYKSQTFRGSAAYFLFERKKEGKWRKTREHASKKRKCISTNCFSPLTLVDWHLKDRNCRGREGKRKEGRERENRGKINKWKRKAKMRGKRKGRKGSKIYQRPCKSRVSRSRN